MLITGDSLLKAKPIPYMETEKVHMHGVSCGLSEAGYDIRILQEVIFKAGWFGRRHVIRRNFNHQNAEWAEGTDYFKGRFVLASAIERFCMPNYLAGRVTDKSSWARQGLSVFNTVIEPGWQGYLTLELVYHGEGELIIPAGAGIAQVLFETVSDKATYKGRYQNQPNRPVAAIHSSLAA